MIMTETEITNDSCSTNENGRQHVISEESQVSISERPQSIAITTTVTDINTQDGIKVSTPESGYIEVDDDTTNNSHQSTADERVVTIIHFNDCYNVEPTENESSGAAGFLTAINQYRHLNPLILFSGDIISPSFMSTFTKGEQMIDVLNSIKVDCAVFGNHEFDYGVDNLISFTKQTTFPWLLSNVIDKETSTQLGDGKVYEIIERNGVKFGLIGLIEEEWLSTLSTISPSDVIYKDFCVEGRQLATWLKQEHQVDYVIALTHMRTPNDIKLADAVPEIDLFLGGHDHVYEIIKRPNGRCIIKSGTDFREFSKIEIVFTSTNTHPSHNHHHQSHCKGNTASDNSLSSLSIALVPSDMRCERIYTLNHPEDAELKKKLEKYHTTINERMNVVLGQFNCDLDGTFSSIRTSETNLGNFVCDIMLASNSADVAILNSGTLRSDRVHRRGDFTMRDLFNILGYIDPIAVLLASGYQIWKALENGVSQWPRLEGRFPQVSGCSFEFDPRKPPGERINPASITIGYESIDLNRKYRLATKAYLASGKDGYDVLKDCPVLVPGDESPDLTTSIVNHFEAIRIYKSKKRTHHRQSLVCISHSSLVKMLEDLGQSGGSSNSDNISNNNNNITKPSNNEPQLAPTFKKSVSTDSRRMRPLKTMSIDQMEIEQAKLEPKVEGRIRLAEDYLKSIQSSANGTQKP